MKFSARTSKPLWTSVVLALLPATFISAYAFQDTAIYSTLETLRKEYKLRQSLSNFSRDFIRELPAEQELQSITIAPSRSSNRSTSQDLSVIITDFLIDRATHELLTSFLERLLTEDNSSSTAILMPALAATIGNLKDYEVSALVPILRSAAIEDLQNLIGNLFAYCQRRSLDETGRNDKTKNNAVPLCDTQLQFGHDATRIDHRQLQDLHKLYLALEAVQLGALPSVGLGRLSEIENNSTCRSRSLHITGILSREWTYSSIEVEIDSEVRTLRDFLFDDIEHRKVFLSHLQEELATWLPVDATVDSLFAGFFQRFVQSDALIVGAKDTKDAVPVIDVLRMTIETVEFVTRSVCPEQDKHDVLYFLLYGYRVAMEGRYTELATSLLRFFDLLSLAERCRDCAEESESIPSSVETEEPEWIPVSVEKLVILAASMAEAKTADEVWEVLTSFADPVGSFATKRTDGTHTTIGAYFGASVGVEIVEGDMGFQIGVALPVGVEVSWGFEDWSLGLFVSPLDLGIIASYRLTETSSERDPKFAWEQLLSPSAYFVFGLPDLPLAIAIGVQYAPELRTVEAMNEDGSLVEREASALRISLMAAVDVTLFRF